MKSHVTWSLLACGTVCLFILTASGQEPDFKFTKVVDINGNPDANFTEIQDAIDAITVGGGEYWTVLIYPGVYIIDGSTAALIELGQTEERISLRGADRQSVIIDVTTAGSGIKITSGTETLRECRISNLTIRTSSGHGIEIVKGGGGGDQTPKDIRIEGVTIEADGSTKDGIYGPDAEDVTVTQCSISSDDDDGVVIGNDWLLSDTTIDAPADNAMGIVVGAHSGSRADRCTVTAESHALNLGSQPVSFSARDSVFTGGSAGTWPQLDENAQQFVFQNCVFFGNHALQAGTPGIGAGVYIDVELGDDPNANFEMRFVGCRIRGTSNSASGAARGVNSDGHFPVSFIDCDISAVNASGAAYGVHTWSGKVVIKGGVVSAKSGDERVADVWDLFRDTGYDIALSGTRFSKFSGPIFSSERRRPVVQRTITVAAADDDAILVETNLTLGEQTLTTGFGQPDEFRCLSIKGNQSGMNQTVYLIGANWAGDAITEAVVLGSTTLIKGVKPFKSVSKIVLPAQNGVGEKVRVGTTDRLGLYYPISATTDVLQQGRKASAATSYTLETVGTVNDTYAWVEIASPAVTGNDSFEWSLLASQ